MTYLANASAASDRQADALLQAWICGDQDGLETALDHITSSRVRPFDRLENTRFELLRMIARGLKSCPNRYASRTSDPILGLYVDLLSFLSNGAPTSFNNSYRS